MHISRCTGVICRNSVCGNACLSNFVMQQWSNDRHHPTCTFTTSTSNIACRSSCCAPNYSKVQQTIRRTQSRAVLSSIALSSHSGKNFFLEHCTSNSNNLDRSRRQYSTDVPPQFRSGEYYAILGIDRKVTQGQIKKAYFELCKVYHPDVNQELSAKATFSLISEAYDVLGNVRKRRMYDIGILKVGASASAHQTAEQDVQRQEAEHRAAERFKRQGGGKERGPVPTGRSQIYDFDEFYKQHYGGMINRKRQARQEQKQVKNQQHSHDDFTDSRVLERETKMRGLITLISALVFAAACFARSAAFGKKPRF